ncbi:Rid family hydrolase [Candidatus Neomarinimicrobiota bacterium]
MKTGFSSFGDSVKGSVFKTSNGAEEYYFVIASKGDTSFERELERILVISDAIKTEYGLSDDTQVFCRIYLSDIVNQENTLLKSGLYREAGKGAVSVIQQRPVADGSVCMFHYHVKGLDQAIQKEMLNLDDGRWRNGVLMRGKDYDMLWVANIAGFQPENTHDQTWKVFEAYNAILQGQGMTLLGNSIKTWVYVDDIDNYYRQMVGARRDFFLGHGLTPETRYIASTGVEGKSWGTGSLVSLDALAVSRLKEEQIIPMNAFDRIPPTINYGVTFERGLRVRFGDRSHLHISGTASINRNGEVLHASDVGRQTRHTLDNIKALINPHGASLHDFVYLIVYLRSYQDNGKVRAVLDEEVPGEIPVIFVEGPICRKEWLVEIEGLAIISDSNSFGLFF